MTDLSGLAATAVVAGYSFGPYRTIVDVGGGHGRCCCPASWRRHQRRRACSTTCREVVAGASALFAQQGVKDRVRIEGGSFFDSVPSGGDAYVLKKRHPRLAR